MFKAALAFIPLLAGYIFVTTWYRTRYLIKREDSQKVYFRAAFWGIWLFLLAFSLLSWCRPELRSIVSFLNSWQEQTILTDGEALQLDLMFWLLVLGLTLFFGMCGGYFLNCLFAVAATPRQELFRLTIRLFRHRELDFPIKIYANSKRSAVRIAIHSLNSDLDILLLRAMEEGMPVSITLASSKVYVGFVTGSIEPGEQREMLRILPLVSGYRQGEAMKLRFSTWYSSIYEQFSVGELSHLRPELFEIVLPLADVKSLNLFDIHAYNAFQNDKGQSYGAETPVS